MANEKIELENLLNTRDLGGYVNENGKRIKPKKLIRSAALYKASDVDKECLCKEYQLNTIVDFRNTDEVTKEPDPKMKGVEYVWCPIFEEKAEGITREIEWDEKDPLGMYLYFGSLMKQSTGENNFANLYVQFVTNEYCISQYKKFFDVLLEEHDGSILWHCSAGKDRCGMGTVFILKALGMSDELIYEDYLLTNQFYADATKKLIELADARGLDASYHTIIQAVNGVRKEFLDSVYKTCNELYGGLNEFMKQKLDLNEEKIERLKDLYLE